MLTIKPALDLDSMIAETVMGYQREAGSDKWRMEKVGMGTIHGPLPKFSNDIDAARLVCEKLKAAPAPMYERFIAELESYAAQPVAVGGSQKNPWDLVSPREICRAALKAYGANV